MTLKNLYVHCSNLNMYTRLCILEEGHEPLKALAADVYYRISNRKIKWFRFENNMLVIKLFKEENK